MQLERQRVRRRVYLAQVAVERGGAPLDGARVARRVAHDGLGLGIGLGLGLGLGIGLGLGLGLDLPTMAFHLPRSSGLVGLGLGLGLVPLAQAW